MKKFSKPPSLPGGFPSPGNLGSIKISRTSPSELPMEMLPKSVLSAVAFAMTGRLANLFPRWISENIGDDWGISGPGLLLVGLLSRTGDLTMSEVAEALDLTPGAVTRIVKGLETAGYVTRVENPDDRRQSFVKLTPAALKKSEHLMPLHDELIAKATESLTEKELRAYLKVAFKLSESLRSRTER